MNEGRENCGMKSGIQCVK